MCICCRYLNLLSDNVEDIENVQKLLDGYVLHGEISSNDSLIDFIDALQRIPSSDNFSLNTQFDILSLTPNNHWWQYRTMSGGLSLLTSRVGLVSHLAYSAVVGHMPTSARNRLIVLMVKENDSYDQALQVVRHLMNQVIDESVGSDTTTTCVCYPEGPPVKRGRRVSTVSRAHIEKDLADNKWSSDRFDELYVSFRERLVVEGVVLWRLNREDDITFVMNDYDSENGDFLPFSFVHTTRITEGTDIYYSCTCAIYNWLQQKVSSTCAGTADTFISVEGLTCMHCRFFKEECEAKLSTLLSNELPPKGSTNMKLISSKTSMNVGVLSVSPINSACFKFSVCSMTFSVPCSFIHLSKDGRFIKCTLGECRAQRGHKKTVQYLLGDAKKSGGLCPHMEVMRANAEEWQHLVKSDSSYSDVSCDTDKTADEANNVDDEGLYIEGAKVVNEV